MLRAVIVMLCLLPSTLLVAETLELDALGPAAEGEEEVEAQLEGLVASCEEAPSAGRDLEREPVQTPGGGLWWYRVWCGMESWSALVFVTPEGRMRALPRLFPLDIGSRTHVQTRVEDVEEHGAGLFSVSLESVDEFAVSPWDVCRDKEDEVCLCEITGARTTTTWRQLVCEEGDGRELGCALLETGEETKRVEVCTGTERLERWRYRVSVETGYRSVDFDGTSMELGERAEMPALPGPRPAPLPGGAVAE